MSTFDEVWTKVAEELRGDLTGLEFDIEEGSKHRIPVPVLFGRDGRVDKKYIVDGLQSKTCTVLEIEAGMGVTNNNYLKDLFEACLMQEIE